MEVRLLNCRSKATKRVRQAQADINQRVQVPSVETGMKRGIALGCDPLKTSPYRVLRGLSRGRLRSVDRECAGRNASCVKGSSPVKLLLPWWPSESYDREGSIGCRRMADTTGVIDHGMYTRLMSEPGRSLRSGVHHRQDSLVGGQGLTAKSATSARGEVRSRHSSEEVG
jgi:hypothetical protein